MRRSLAVLALTLAAVLGGIVGAPAQAADTPQACSYTYTLRATFSDVVWDGPTGERMVIAVQIQTADTPPPCEDRIRLVATFRCFVYGSPANCGAYGHDMYLMARPLDSTWYTRVEASRLGPWNVGSSGTDGVFGVNAPWVDLWSCRDWDGYIYVDTVAVAGRSSVAKRPFSPLRWQRCEA